ncbi:hypothetical protein ACU18_18435 [Arthrobacter sp. ZBG10]|uniref:LexA family protein n=1 Tax=Arthrobacter sp. ZBG10 TaxID=1676590 RepID=UPI00068288FC|nr:translesion error-prone DNA polymerase V autoproteolytic subunit [Arthrobacter sp. ZBG10]KNH13533.1 hypothetical protein ACU18_18435 [Arthrobacter sp. ZBG10]
MAYPAEPADSAGQGAAGTGESFLPVGFASPAQDYFSGRIDLNKHLINDITSTFILRVAGDGMRASGIFDGDELIVDRSLTARSGSVVVAVVDGELIIRRLHLAGDELTLTADDPGLAPITVTAGVDLAVWGVATRCLHRV